MEKSQTTGAIIMAGAVLQMIIFLMAISRRSYVAIAIPVLGALGTVSALAFWIGWTMFSSEDEDDEELEPVLTEA